jgi:anthranilate/para-aminobenzoate synthase component I
MRRGLHARVVARAPHPLRIARSLADEPGFAFLWTPTGGGPSYVACRPIAEAESLDPEPALTPDAEDSPAPLAAVPRWIGLLPYESRRTLERARLTRTPEDRPAPLLERPVWLRYGAVVRVGEDVQVVGDDASAVSDVVARLGRDGSSEPVFVAAAPDVESDEVHAARIRRALELILEGEIYQVNLARRFDFLVRGRAVDLVERLVRRARVPYAAAFSLPGDLRVAVSSPELFLDVSRTGRLVTLPIKGTRPRGLDAVADRALVTELSLDPKERAELSMVVDVERNDLGRVARTGTVRVPGSPEVITYGSVHHRAARVVAELRAGVSREALLEAMLPSGSVTGAPKIRAMELIGTLETARRGLYTGALGYLAHDGSMRLAMAIRTLVARERVGHYFSGGGIVLGSDPSKEVEETRWKAAQILGLSTDPP